MNEEVFKQIVKDFFKAVKEKTLLIIIDSASMNDKAVFSLVSFDKKNDGNYGYKNFSNLLQELGFKNYGRESVLFVTYCAGRFSLYILDNIGQELKRLGVKLPKNYFDMIQCQNVI